MAMKKKPVTGMKDILPEEMELRDYLIGIIKDTYRSFGFTPMETPCVEHIENLTSKQGGDNEKLIFKILKRGEKLVIDSESTENDLADSGLRYDLTLPLSRYYANNGAVDAGYYYTSASAARADANLTWKAAGTALVRPYNHDGYQTMQLIRYTVY